MKWVFQKDRMRWLRGDSEFPLWSLFFACLSILLKISTIILIKKEEATMATIKKPFCILGIIWIFTFILLTVTAQAEHLSIVFIVPT